MQKFLTEEISGYTSLGNLKVDRVGAVVHNVKIIGFHSANEREYTPEALRQAIPMYEGVNVNIDHPDGSPDEQRSAWDRIGFLKNVKFVEGKGLYGDLHLLPSHPFTERILEAAEKMPQIYGLSHNAKGEGFEDKKTKRFVVNKVIEVRHVDLVADPATTHSLAESKEAEVSSEQEAEEGAYTRVGYKSRKRGVGAKRGYVKTKKKLHVSHESQESEDSDGDRDESYEKLHARVIDILKHDGVPDHQKADQITDLITGGSSKHEGSRKMKADDQDEKDKDTKEAVSGDDKDIRTDDPGDSDTEESEGKEVCPKCKGKMKTEGCCGEEKGKMKESEEEDDDEEDDEEDAASQRKMAKAKKTKGAKESKDISKSVDNVKDLCESHKLTTDESLIKELALVPEDVVESIIKRLANAERLLKPKSSNVSKESKKSEVDMLEGKQLFSWLKN